MAADLMPAAGAFGLISALTHGLIQVAVHLAKRKTGNENGQSHEVNRMQFDIVRGTVKEAKDDISSGIEKLEGRLERIERSLAVCAASKGK